MQVKYHVLSAVPVGVGSYAVSGDVLTAVIGMAAAVFIDIDHIIDYVITQKRIDNPSKMMEAFDTFSIVTKNYFFLHSWELVILLAWTQLLWPHPYVLAALVGYTMHLTIDQIYNTFFLGEYNLKHFFYFLTYRSSYKFDVLPLRQNGDRIEINARIYS